MKRPTQTQRILRMLEVAGPAGITQLDMMRPLDGGAPIMALSQRIGDLVRAGHVIESRRQRTTAGAQVARYVLVRRANATNPDLSRATFTGTLPETSCKTTEAQPEEQTLVHSTTRPETRA